MTRTHRRTTGLAAVAAAALAFATVPAVAQTDSTSTTQSAPNTGTEGQTVTPPRGMMGGMMRGYPMGPGMMQGNGMGPGMMQGYGQGYGMGPGMMQRYGMGPGMMRGCRGMMQDDEDQGVSQYGYVRPPLQLSISDVKGYFEEWVARTGNSHIKVGPVTEKDKTTITVDIDTKDGSLVQRFDVNRATGYYQPAG